MKINIMAQNLEDSYKIMSDLLEDDTMIDYKHLYIMLLLRGSRTNDEHKLMRKVQNKIYYKLNKDKAKENYENNKDNILKKAKDRYNKKKQK